MSQALNLLNSLSSEEVARYTITPANEPHMVINADRTITVPDYLKRIAVQHDHNIETVTFDCPRYWDDNDMSKMIVYINYMLPNNVLGAYIARNIAVDSSDSSMMHFTWTITNEITQHKGNIAFLVCIKKTEMQIVDGEEQAVEVNHWNSELNRDLYISEGLECEVGVAQLYPDIVTQLLERMTSVEQINIQASEMESILEETRAVAATAEETKNEALDASNHIKNSYAPAIKGVVSGELVRVDDVSPIGHDVKCYVHGKNQLSLVGTPGLQSTQSLTYRSWLVNPERKTMTLSIVEKDSSIDISDIYFGFCENGMDGLDGIKWLIEDGVVKNQGGVYSDLPYVSVYPPEQETVDKLNARFNIQLENGSVPTSYEPWIDPATVTVTCSNKNIFSYPFDGTNYGNGIHFTDAGGGSIIVHGTNDGTSNSVFYITKDSYLTIPAGVYSCSPNVVGVVLIGVEKGGGYFTLASESKMTFTLSEPKTFRSIYVQIAKGNTTTFHNKKIRIMLEYGSILSKFESPTSMTYIPTSDGACNVISKSPTMTLFTDTPGVIIEAEYNRDTTKMFESYVLTDDAKNEIAAIINNHVLTDAERVEIANMVEEDFADILASLNAYANTLIAGE